MTSPKRSKLISTLTGTPAMVVMALLLAGAVALMLMPGEKPKSVSLTKYESYVTAGKVKTATVGMKSNKVTGKFTDGVKYEVVIPHEYSDELTKLLLKEGVTTKGDNEDDSALSTFLSDYLPTFMIIGVFAWFAVTMSAGGKAGKFGQTRSKRKTAPEVRFSDVAGAEEAVAELAEIKEFLENPEKFSLLGARIPRGVLLVGPPGTGKTLLAKAVAGEAGVPFFTIAGSDFVEMFVGVGAARVRDLFKQAKNSAPAIIFVDEIDAVGRHRGAGTGGGHDEREQTLNQLLVEMDGFDTETGVILMAATNRPDILDPALLRPGRFDRQIVVDAPDLRGREAILNVHARNKPLADDVDLAVLARRTPGFTGADLANVINESALLCGRRNDSLIRMNDVSEAVERVMSGPERKSRIMGERERALTAFHEAGHALVGHVLPLSDPIHKVSIVARGQALGWTLALPTEDRFTTSRGQLLADMAMLLGGRTAEELVFDEITTGAQNDIDRASRIARAMVTEYGMSDVVGPQRLAARDDGRYLVGGSANRVDYSDEVASTVDVEVKRLLDDAHETARRILTDHRVTLDLLAGQLLERETLDETDLAELFAQMTEAPSV